MTIERRNITIPTRSLELRSVEGRGQILQGYAAVFYRATDPGTQFFLWENSQGKKYVERFMPGAFDGALQQDVRCLFNHRSDNLLGRSQAGTLTLRIDAVGLWYECRLPETLCGQDVAKMVQRGDISGNSIGMLVTEEDMIQEGDTIWRSIKKLDLYDVGPVTFPAYAGTSVDVAKRSIETWETERSKRIAAERRRKAALARLRG